MPAVSHVSTALRRSIASLERDGVLEELIWEDEGTPWLPLKEISEKDAPYIFRKFFKTSREQRDVGKSA